MEALNEEIITRVDLLSEMYIACMPLKEELSLSKCWRRLVTAATQGSISGARKFPNCTFLNYDCGKMKQQKSFKVYKRIHYWLMQICKTLQLHHYSAWGYEGHYSRRKKCRQTFWKVSWRHIKFFFVTYFLCLAER